MFGPGLASMKTRISIRTYTLGHLYSRLVAIVPSLGSDGPRQVQRQRQTGSPENSSRYTIHHVGGRGTGPPPGATTGNYKGGSGRPRYPHFRLVAPRQGRDASRDYASS